MSEPQPLDVPTAPAETEPTAPAETEPTDPAEPQPVRVDLFRVAQVGTAVWLVALLVTGIVWIATGAWMPAAVCATGAALGGVMARWSRTHDDRGRRAR